MKKIIFSIAFLLMGLTLVNATVPPKKVVEQEKSGEVITLNRDLFIEKVFDYVNNENWEYRGNKPAIIDLYADWCGPCRKVAPIMKELASEYGDEIVIYKVDVDKERELAAIFNATSIPLFVFIPMNDEPQLFKGAADKETYKKVIDQFLLGKKAE
ncbi:MAG: thioredoxin domain-containing protein [Bacteroides sp.]|nr:thioredoxin domain-containing protein [Bacteroides sp.]